MTDEKYQWHDSAAGAQFIKSSVVDPDPHGSAFLVLVGWNRIALGMRIWIQEGKNYQEK
jgi:hypothetical protein